jgi:hypothetical protein
MKFLLISALRLKVHELNHTWVSPPAATPLGELMRQYFSSSCSDPRDRVFALLGLVLDDERDILCHFFPDYSLSLEKVMHITISFLAQGFYAPLISAYAVYTLKVLGLAKAVWKELVEEAKKYETSASKLNFWTAGRAEHLRTLEQKKKEGRLSK